LAKDSKSSSFTPTCTIVYSATGAASAASAAGAAVAQGGTPAAVGDAEKGKEGEDAMGNGRWDGIEDGCMAGQWTGISDACSISSSFDCMSAGMSDVAPAM
jgi:hypothetical protein